MSSPGQGVRLRLRDGVLELEPGRPKPIGIVNATPDSFSDRQGMKSLDALVARGLTLAKEGAAVIDVGGESGRTDRFAISEDEESSRVVPVIERLANEGLLVSVDTWRVGPARDALDAGASMLNDVSCLSDPTLAQLCARTGAGLVIAHTRARPKVKQYEPGAADDVVEEVVATLASRCTQALELGVDANQLIVDPGFDLGKQVGESIGLLRRLGELEVLERPLLLAISRKDFIGAVTGRSPAARGAGTLGAIEPALDVGTGVLLRVHDVAATIDFVRLRRALRGDWPPLIEGEPGWLDPALRREPA